MHGCTEYTSDIFLVIVIVCALRALSSAEELVLCSPGQGSLFRVAGSNPTVVTVRRFSLPIMRGCAAVSLTFFQAQSTRNPIWLNRQDAELLITMSPVRNLDTGFFRFFTFLSFHGSPIGVRELAWVFDFSIYWSCICLRRMHVFSKHVFSKHVFSKRMFSTSLFRNVIFYKHELF